MNLSKYSKTYEGEIKIVDFDIEQLINQHRDEYMKSLWEEHRSSKIPVLVKVPYMKPNQWKQIRMTKMFLTCDTENVNIEAELRLLLAPQPNFIERIQIRFYNFFSKNEKIILNKIPHKLLQISDLSMI